VLHDVAADEKIIAAAISNISDLCLQQYVRKERVEKGPLLSVVHLFLDSLIS
jgi:hypothetical protein